MDSRQWVEGKFSVIAGKKKSETQTRLNPLLFVGTLAIVTKITLVISRKK